MNILFFCIISVFLSAQTMQTPNDSLMILPLQLIVQMPLYIAHVAKDADEAVQTLIKLGRVNKYYNALVKLYLTEPTEYQEESNYHKALIQAVEQKWESRSAATCVMLGVASVWDKKEAALREQQIKHWLPYSLECFAYAVHANKTAITITTPESMEVPKGNQKAYNAQCKSCLDLGIRSYKFGTPLLKVAIEKGNSRIVKRLLNLGADPKDLINVELDDRDKLTTTDLLTFAKQKGNQEIIMMLDDALNPKGGLSVSMGEISLR